MKILATAIFGLMGLWTFGQEQIRKAYALNDIDKSKTYLFYLHGQVTIEKA